MLGWEEGSDEGWWEGCLDGCEDGRCCRSSGWLLNSAEVFEGGGARPDGRFVMALVAGCSLLFIEWVLVD